LIKIIKTSVVKVIKACHSREGGNLKPKIPAFAGMTLNNITHALRCGIDIGTYGWLSRGKSKKIEKTLTIALLFIIGI